jgi:glycerophosphoryl diester phosphodiesterase
MPKERPQQKPPLRIGHRGAAGHAPENTLASVRKAIEFGVDLVEVDVRRSRDAHLVLVHDETVDRTTNGTGRVADLSISELRALETGPGAGIPTLEELLETAQGRVGLMLELKEAGLADLAVETVRRGHFTGTVIYASFLHEELRAVRTADPKAATLALFEKLPTEPLTVTARVGATHVGLRFPLVTRSWLRAFREAGLPVFVFTVNKPRDIRAMQALGVDGIISDFPDRW